MYDEIHGRRSNRICVETRQNYNSFKLDHSCVVVNQLLFKPFPTMSAFIAPFTTFIRSSPASPKCARRRPTMLAGENEPARVHDSWKVYEKPGNLCVLCNGKGDTRCLFCFGEGSIKIGPETARDSLTCTECHGSGIEECIRCEGSGKRPSMRYDVKSEKFVPNMTNEQVRNLKPPSQAI